MNNELFERLLYLYEEECNTLDFKRDQYRFVKASDNEITGDRFWGCPDLAERVLNRLLARYGPDLVIIHGGANGVDQAFHVAARELGIDVEPHLADWKGLANIAGTARNREMVEAGADLCLALHRSLETSMGTKDCVRQALAAGIPVYLIEDERAVPKRVLAVDTGTV